MIDGEGIVNQNLDLRKTRSDLRKEDSERDRRVKRLIVILLLLLLLLFAVGFAYLVFFSGELQKALRPEDVQFEFSIYGFDRPLGVSTDRDGNIIVSDTGHNRVIVFDKSGDFLRRIGSEKRRERMFGVLGTVNEGGKIFAADWKVRKIKVFTSKGKFIKQFPKDPFDQTFGSLGFSPYGLQTYKNKLYITSNDGIYIFSKNGKLLDKWGSKGAGIDQFDYPIGIAIDKKDGYVYVADQLNRRVKALDSKGKVRWIIGGPDSAGKINSFFGLPRGVAIDNKGHVYIADTFHNEIYVVSKKGKLISFIGKRGLKDGQFNFPEGLTFAPDNAMYVADRENNRIQIIRVYKLPEIKDEVVDKYKTFFTKISN